MRFVRDRNKHPRIVIGSCAMLAVFLLAASPAPAEPGCNTAKPAVAKKVTRTPIPPGVAVPVWSCPENKVVNPPVWHGVMIECEFLIENKGEAVLDIKAQGG